MFSGMLLQAQIGHFNDKPTYATRLVYNSIIDYNERAISTVEELSNRPNIKISTDPHTIVVDGKIYKQPYLVYVEAENQKAIIACNTLDVNNIDLNKGSFSFSPDYEYGDLFISFTYMKQGKVYIDTYGFEESSHFFSLYKEQVDKYL